MNIPEAPLKRRARKPRHRRTIFLVSILVLAMFPTAYFLYQKTGEIKDSFKQYEAPVDDDIEPPGEPEIINEQTLKQDLIINRISIPLANQKEHATVDVYWHSSSTLYLLIKELPLLPPGEKYQVWSVSGNDRSNLGIFNPPRDGKLIIRTEKELMTNTYDITIVKAN